MSGAGTISGIPGRTIEAGDGPVKRPSAAVSTADEMSSLHSGMEA